MWLICCIVLGGVRGRDGWERSRYLEKARKEPRRLALRYAASLHEKMCLLLSLLVVNGGRTGVVGP